MVSLECGSSDQCLSRSSSSAPPWPPFSSQWHQVTTREPARKGASLCCALTGTVRVSVCLTNKTVRGCKGITGAAVGRTMCHDQWVSHSAKLCSANVAVPLVVSVWAESSGSAPPCSVFSAVIQVPKYYTQWDVQTALFMKYWVFACVFACVLSTLSSVLPEPLQPSGKCNTEI